MTKSVISLLFYFIITLNGVKGQEMLGVVNSNYAGVLGLQINPSSTVSSKLFLDIHVLSFDFFIQNNFLYIPREDYRFRNFFGPGADMPTYGEDNMIFARRPDTDHKRKQIDQYLRINGPSVMLVKDIHAVSIFSSFRAVTSAWRLPYDLAIFGYEDLWYYPQHDIEYSNKNFNGIQLTWGEFGIGYSLVLNRNSINRWTAGVTLSRLLGYAGAYMYGQELNYIVRDESDGADINLTANILNFNGEAGFSLPMDYDDMSFSSPGGLFRGGGFSTSIGITYLKLLKNPAKIHYKRRCEQRYEDYIYRLGISLVDLGWITFRENAQKHLYEDVSHYWEYINNTDFDNLNSFMHELSARFYNGDPTQSLISNRITMYLPTALSAQFDYHVRKRWYVNSMIIIPVMFSISQIYRPPQLALTGRYETNNLEVSIPVSLYYFTRPRIGLSLRLWNFTIGSDHLGGFFHMTDFTGMNLYAAVKVNFNKGSCFRMNRKVGCGTLEF